MMAQQIYGAAQGANLGLTFGIQEAVSREEEDPSLTHDAVGTPWSSINEQRAREGLDPVTDGDNLAKPAPKAVVTQ